MTEFDLKLGHILLQNQNGVKILKHIKCYGHHYAYNATCYCGERLLVAPAAFQAEHKPGDPVMVCGDHGVHSYRFSELTPGKQND